MEGEIPTIWSEMQKMIKNVNTVPDTDSDATLEEQAYDEQPVLNIELDST
jgi:hypothetical protein